MFYLDEFILKCSHKSTSFQNQVIFRQCFLFRPPWKNKIKMGKVLFVLLFSTTKILNVYCKMNKINELVRILSKKTSVEIYISQHMCLCLWEIHGTVESTSNCIHNVIRSTATLVMNVKSVFHFQWATHFFSLVIFPSDTMKIAMHFTCE